MTSPKQVGRWEECLAFMGPERLAVTETGRRARLEIFDLTRVEANTLHERFGGQIRDLEKSNADWVRGVVQRRPISIRRRLLVYNAEPGPDARNDHRVLYIPAGMAFGTGDHATTATCLRMLCDQAAGLPGWSFLDIGCGSGILTLAAVKLGATRAEGFDYDPVAVRIAGENARLNGLPQAHFFQGDIFEFKPARPYEVVAANVYSEVLARAAARLWACVNPGGLLILSGILRAQLDEIKGAFQPLGAQCSPARIRGKWGTLACTRPDAGALPPSSTCSG